MKKNTAANQKKGKFSWSNTKKASATTFLLETAVLNLTSLRGTKAISPK